MLTPDEEFETCLRDLLEPTPETVSRVKATALQVDPRRRVWMAPFALASVLAVLVVVAALGFWRRESAAVQPDVFTAEFVGDVLVIRGPNGSMTLLGPPVAAPSSQAGGSQITYEGSAK